MKTHPITRQHLPSNGPIRPTDEAVASFAERVAAGRHPSRPLRQDQSHILAPTWHIVRERVGEAPSGKD